MRKPDFRKPGVKLMVWGIALFALALLATVFRAPLTNGSERTGATSQRVGGPLIHHTRPVPNPAAQVEVVLLASWIGAMGLGLTLVGAAKLPSPERN